MPADSSKSNRLVKGQKEKKIGKKESQSKQGEVVQVNFWKHLCKENETFKQPFGLLKVKELVDKHVIKL